MKEVLDAYKAEGADAVDAEYRILSSALCRNASDENIPNTNYLHGLFLTDLMLQRARHHIRILDAASGFASVSVLKSSFDSALQRMKEAGDGYLRVILLGKKTCPVLSQLHNKFGDKVVQYLFARTSTSMRHFIVIDGRMSRIEEVHEPVSGQSPADLIKAIVCFNNKNRAKAWSEYFDRLWDFMKPGDV